MVIPIKIPTSVFEDICRYISAMYQFYFPNSLLIAQAFILKYPNYGRKFGLSAINYAIEDGIKEGMF
jgi:hypothetical protein